MRYDSSQKRHPEATSTKLNHAHTRQQGKYCSVIGYRRISRFRSHLAGEVADVLLQPPEHLPSDVRLGGRVPLHSKGKLRLNLRDTFPTDPIDDKTNTTCSAVLSWHARGVVQVDPLASLEEIPLPTLVRQSSPITQQENVFTHLQQALRHPERQSCSTNEKEVIAVLKLSLTSAFPCDVFHVRGDVHGRQREAGESLAVLR